MVELELEKTYLLKELPADLADCKSEILSDAYVPVTSRHPNLRLRRKGDQYQLTKKIPVSGTDSSRQNEHTILLTPEEAAAFDNLEAKRFTKRRHYCTIDGYAAEVDVYLEGLAGLVVVDFEFTSEADMEAFVMPDICLADVTQEEAFAGGILAGKTYADIEPALQSYGYQPLFLKETA